MNNRTTSSLPAATATNNKCGNRWNTFFSDLKSNKKNLVIIIILVFLILICIIYMLDQNSTINTMSDSIKLLLSHTPTHSSVKV